MRVPNRFLISNMTSSTIQHDCVKICEITRLIRKKTVITFEIPLLKMANYDDESILASIITPTVEL